MYRLLSMIVVLVISGIPVAVNAQSVEAKLGGTSSAESFTIVNADGDTVVIFRADGKAGFGISAPEADLEVNGTVQAAAFTGNGSGLSGVVTAAAAPLEISNDTVKISAAVTGNLLTFDGNNWVAADLVTGSTGSGVAIDNMPPFQVVRYCIATEGTYPSRTSADPLLGEIMAVGFNFAPRGWADCNGASISIAENTALFSLLGDYYGGDARTYFNVPDLRGRVPVGYGSGTGLTYRNLGSMGGRETTTLSTSNLPAHTHTVITQ